MREATNQTVSGVSPGADHDGDAGRALAWAERSFWTERMLTALVNGVQGGKWYCLIDKVGSERVLDAAWQQVRRNRGASGVDGQTVGTYDRAYRRLHPKLSRQIQEGRYRVQPVRRVWIPKPGQRGAQRPLGIPTVVDRVVQQALRFGLEPIFERRFHAHSYGFRPGCSAKDALHHVVRTMEEGRQWVVDADLSSFFDTIDHDLLLAEVEREVSDGAVLRLIRQFLEAGVLEQDSPDVQASTTGTPQGGVISPLLANIYLNELDHLVNESGHVLIRYADDFVILCRSESEAQNALALVRDWVARRRLRLHSEKTRMVDMRQEGTSFDFLGFTLKRSRDRRSGRPRILRLPRAGSERRLRDGIRQVTRRCNGRSLPVIIALVNERLRGWGVYFRSAVRPRLEGHDKWVRMRLRSILRQRTKRKGRGRGRDHNRWPNAFFAECGLISLVRMHDAWVSP